MAAIVRRYCPVCAEYVPASRNVSHVLHLLLTLCTAGFWVWVWIYFALCGERVCTRCGCGNLSESKKSAATQLHRQQSSTLSTAITITVIGALILIAMYASH